MFEERTRGSLFSPAAPDPAISEEPGRKGRKHTYLAWTALIVALLAGLGWFGLPLLSDRQAVRREIPAVQNSLLALGKRVNGAEQDLRDWYARQKQLQADVSSLRKSVDAKLQASRRQAQEFAEILYRRASVEMENRTGRMEKQLAGLQSAEETEAANVAAVQSQLAQLRNEADRLTAQIAASDQNDRSNREGLGRRLAGIDVRAENTEGEMHRFIRSVEPQRIDFEIAAHRSRELAEGISVCVTDTDIARRRVNGWIWVMPDRRSIFLRGQGALQPVTFYPQSDGLRREIVFTNVGHDSVAGYLLLPSTLERPASGMARSAPSGE